MKDNTRLSTLKKLINRAHFEVMRGTHEEAINYCKKDGDVSEFGEPPNPGKRNDLLAVKNDIMDGIITVDDLCIENPMMVHQYGRTLDRIEDIRMRNIFRTEMTKCIWYYGSTGVGKSHKAFDGFSDETHYVYPNDNGWFDDYKRQDTVIINDFRGEIKYNELLQMIDKWPYSVKRRNRPPMPFTSKLVIITSSLPPAEIYRNRLEEDKLEQLYRRIELVNLSRECPEGNTETSGTVDIADNIDTNVDWNKLLKEI